MKPETFRPEPDVAREIAAAKAMGYRLTWIVNSALRKWFKLPAPKKSRP